MLLVSTLLKWHFAVFLIGLLVLLTSLPAYAQQQIGGGQNTPKPTQNATTIQDCNAATGQCQTDLGPVPLEPAGVVNFIMKFAVGIGGTLALILIIWGAFRIVTSSGNPQEVTKGKEIITYAIIGLLLILFSVLIVSVVGGGIIQIPDFSGG